MNRRRAALACVAFLAIAALGAAIALHSLLDPQRLERIAKDKARAAGLGELSIGSVSLALFPFPALAAENVSVPGLARIQRFSARLALIPLLSGTARYKRIDLEDVEINIEADKAASRPKLDALADLEALHVTHASIRFKPRAGAATTWNIGEALAESGPGWRDVRIEGDIERDRRTVKLKAAFDNLSRLGKEGAASQGRIDADWGDAQLAVEGRFPLDGALAGHALRTDLQGTSLGGMLAFLGIPGRRTAAAKAHVETSEAQGVVTLANLQATLGGLKVSGEGRITTGAKPMIDARLATENLDWVQAQLDAGAPPVPPLEPEEMFYDIPLAWDLLEAMQGLRGHVDARVGRLLLRNGLELRNFRGKIAFEDDRVNAPDLASEMLGGNATASVQLEGRSKSAHVKFEGTNLLLERWFRERGSVIAFSGGPMKVNATIAATGASMKKLAASMTGPVTIRMGPGVLASEKAGKAEATMTGLTPGLAARDATQIDFECAGAALPFSNGRAQAQPIIGARSSASALLTSGTVDFREQVLDLHGRLKAKSGVNLGLGAIAGDVLVSGKIRKPHMSLDPAKAPAAVARGIAAVATLGLSVVGTGLADAASARKDDPCEVIFK